MNAPTIPTQRRQVATCSAGHPVDNLLGTCIPCLRVELDMDVADDLRSEACDDE
jgi:hypothetical protein